MLPAILEALRWAGLGGLIAYLVVTIVQVPGLGRWRPLIAVVGILSLVAIFIVDKYSVLVPPPPQNSSIHWLALADPVDWGGHDRACSRGATPKTSIPELALCDRDNVGRIAVCWEDRPSGFPQGVPGDCPGSRAWCTYKDTSITAFTPRTGQALGRGYICSASSGS